MSTGAVSPVPREARPYQGQAAGLVTRLIANVLDAGVIAGIMLAGYLGINGLIFLVEPRNFHFLNTSLLTDILLASAFAILYFALAWATTGRTYGCHVMGLRVVNRAGERPGPVVALLRAVLCVLLPIGLLWCAGGRAHRSVQDVVAGTFVIYDWQPRGNQLG